MQRELLTGEKRLQWIVFTRREEPLQQSHAAKNGQSCQTLPSIFPPLACHKRAGAFVGTRSLSHEKRAPVAYKSLIICMSVFFSFFFAPDKFKY